MKVRTQLAVVFVATAVLTVATPADARTAPPAATNINCNNCQRFTWSSTPTP